MLSLHCSCTSPPSPRLVFGDIYRILRTAVDESLSSGTREQVLELYLDMLEPFFGLEPRAAELEAVRLAAAELSEDDGDATGTRPAGPIGGGGRGGRGGRGRGGHRHHHHHRQQQAAAAAAAMNDGSAGGGDGDGDAKSESSDQEGTKNRGDEEMTDMGKLCERTHGASWLAGWQWGTRWLNKGNQRLQLQHIDKYDTGLG